MKRRKEPAVPTIPATATTVPPSPTQKIGRLKTVISSNFIRARSAERSPARRSTVVA